MAGDNVLRFKNPYDAYEHCSVAMAEWHPQWQAALRAADLAQLKSLEERFRRRVLAVFPKDAYSGSWAGANANFGYRLSELSEFERPLEHMTEARALYVEALPRTAPDWHNSLRATNEHCCAEVVLRYAEVSGDRAALDQSARLCEQAIERDTSEKQRALATLGAVRRRIAEHDRTLTACEAALATLQQAETDYTPENGTLDWALQRQTLAAVLLITHELGGEADLAAARAAVHETLANYDLNPHGFWIRPSRIEDATRTEAQIGRGKRQ